MVPALKIGFKAGELQDFFAGTCLHGFSEPSGPLAVTNRMWVVWMLVLEVLAALGADTAFFTLLRRFKVYLEMGVGSVISRDFSVSSLG